MPEGPTVKVTTDRLRAALLGQQVEHVRTSFKKATVEAWVPKITGQVVETVRAHGKNMFIDFANGWTLYSHFLMWGAWHIYAKNEPWLKEARKARVVLETARHCVVLFSAPVCELIHVSELGTHPTSELGPDLLKDDWTPHDRAEVWQRLVAQGDTPLGAALMNQTVMAGIGNILKSEILFATGLHPLRRADALSEAEFDQLIDQSRALMQRAYTTDGFAEVFLPPALRQAAGSVGYVYQRSKRPCLQCGTPIELLRQGQLERTTFFCPHCQPFDPRNPTPPRPATSDGPYRGTVHSLADAHAYVLRLGMVGVLHDPQAKLPTLWEAVTYPDRDSAESGWGAKLAMISQWKTELPATYPHDIFYGKIRGGRMVLMSMDRLDELYQQQHTSIDVCSELAQQIYAVIEQGPINTSLLRQALGMTDRAARAPFDRALQELQTTFNIARLNQPDLIPDTWVPFNEVVPDQLLPRSTAISASA